LNEDREAIIRQVEAQVGARPPEALLDVWTGATPVDAAVDVSLYGPAEIAERNLTYEVREYAPHLLLIGDDGGGQGLFVARNKPDPETLLIGLGALGSDGGTPIGRLSSLAADGFRAVHRVGTREGVPVPTGPIDVMITRPPGVKALVEIRKLLRLSLPISKLAGPDVQFPMVVLTNVRYAKYAENISQLNHRYRCLAVRPHGAT
jgi:hypothetical protein